MSEPDSTPLLEARDISYSYGAISALSEVNLTVGTGEAVCVIGPNGAGKTTFSRVVGGLYRPGRGRCWSTVGRSRVRPSRSSLAVSPACSRDDMCSSSSRSRPTSSSGCYRSGVDKDVVAQRLERTMDLFPVLRKRANQRTSTMSGGEQQMVAIGRALMSEPRLLVLDEPSMGLAPKITGEVFDALERLRSEGLSILLIEQNAPLAFELADRGYLMRQGSIVTSGTIEELERDDVVRTAYLGA